MGKLIDNMTVQISTPKKSIKLFLLLAVLVTLGSCTAPVNTTCYSLKSQYQENSCCAQDMTKAAIFDTVNVTCGNILSSYTGSECCSADAAKNATMIFPTSATTSIPSNEPISIPSNEPISIPSNEPTSIPSDVPSSIPSNEPTSIPSDVPSSIPSSEPDSASCQFTCEAGGAPTGSTCDSHQMPCFELEFFEGCDCTGCACTDDFPF